MTILKVIIPKGEMPKGCIGCRMLRIDESGRTWCELSLKKMRSIRKFYNSRHPDCPLEEEE